MLRPVEQTQTRAIGPLGKELTRASLPPGQFCRWNARRKAEVVMAINQNLLSLEEARILYGITRDELSSWCVAFDRYGLKGLRQKALLYQRRCLQQDSVFATSDGQEQAAA